MFSEVLKLVPSVDRSAMEKMFRTLSQRFATVAKKFGQGMKNALKLSPLIAIGGALIAKLLNPLQKAEEIIDRMTGRGDDAVTNAEEFGTEAGKLIRLEALGAAKGLDAETMRSLLGKFQSALAKEQEVAKDPKAAPGTLRQFVGETDMADAFFKFIQSLQKVEKSRQVVVQNEIFGEKIRGKAAEFFNATDFAEILKKLPGVDKLNSAAEKLGGLADLKDLMAAIRNTEDIVVKSELINKGQIKQIDQSKRNELRGENEDLRQFDSLKSTSIAVQELTHKFDKFATAAMSELAPRLIQSLDGLKMIFEAMTPLLLEAKELLATGFDKTLQAMAKASVWAETAWAEFKSSRIYKFMGGGK